MPRRTVWLLVLLAIIVGIGLRSYELTARSLWFDEAFSWRLIQFPVAEMIARAATDVHPPLYYLLLKGWSVIFATSLLSLRSFSVVMAGLTIYCGYLFTSYALRSRSAGLLAATLLALSGWQIQFAWEARMYTLGTTLILLSSWLFLRAIRRHRLIDWIFYAIAAVALLYVHYYALFSIAAHIIFIAGYIILSTRGRIGEILQWPFSWYAVSAFGLTFLLFLPWLPTFITQNSQVQAAYWIPAIGGWSIPDTFYRMFLPTATIPRHLGLGWIILAALPMTATILGLILLVLKPITSSRTRAVDADWLIFLSATTPFVLSIIMSFTSQSLYQDRFFVFAHLFIIIGLAALLKRQPFKTVRLAICALVAVGFLAAYLTYWHELKITQHPGSQAALATISHRWQPGDQILASSPFIYFAALHYAQENYHLPDPRLYSETKQLAHFAGGPILTTDDIVGPATFSQHNNLWIIDTTGFGASPLVPPDDWQPVFTQSFTEVFAHQGDVLITYYQKK